MKYKTTKHRNRYKITIERIDIDEEEEMYPRGEELLQVGCGSEVVWDDGEPCKPIYLWIYDDTVDEGQYFYRIEPNGKVISDPHGQQFFDGLSEELCERD